LFTNPATVGLRHWVPTLVTEAARPDTNTPFNPDSGTGFGRLHLHRLARVTTGGRNMHARYGVCEACSLRQHYPDQVVGGHRPQSVSQPLGLPRRLADTLAIFGLVTRADQRRKSLLPVTRIDHPKGERIARWALVSVSGYRYRR
jgi:hypothetical protein